MGVWNTGDPGPTDAFVGSRFTAEQQQHCTVTGSENDPWATDVVILTEF
jgi:hypothetical protein